MKFVVAELEREPVEFDVTLPPGSIDFVEEVRQTGGLHTAGRAELLREHRGPGEVVPDIRIRATLQVPMEVACARCLEPVAETLDTDFDLVFRPREADAADSDHAITTAETEIGYYEGDGISLTDVLREQVLLALPARTLCREDCKGICPECGQNRNAGTCNCGVSSTDPRWSALKSIQGRKES
jgi:uncharacterized protein